MHVFNITSFSYLFFNLCFVYLGFFSLPVKPYIFRINIIQRRFYTIYLDMSQFGFKLILKNIIIKAIFHIKSNSKIKFILLPCIVWFLVFRYFEKRFQIPLIKWCLHLIAIQGSFFSV